jgi:type IV secretory pathway VirB10-like protein
MPVEEERATGLPDPPPVPPPRPKKPVKEGEESPAPPPKAPAEEPVPPPPPKKIAEEDGADDSDEDPLDLENGSDDDDVGATEPERGKAAAMANSLQLRRKQRKDARGAVAKALEAWLADAAAKAAELSTAHGVPLEDVKAMMGSSGKLKKKRGYDEFKAKVWRRTAELNEGSFFNCFFHSPLD